jgi:hypothetical protein
VLAVSPYGPDDPQDVRYIAKCRYKAHKKKTSVDYLFSLPFDYPTSKKASLGRLASFEVYYR